MLSHTALPYRFGCPRPTWPLRVRRWAVSLDRTKLSSSRRKVKQHDTIHVAFPLRTRLMLVDAQHPEAVAVMHGPLAHGSMLAQR